MVQPVERAEHGIKLRLREARTTIANANARVILTDADLGMTYTPVYISQEEYDAIINSPMFSDCDLNGDGIIVAEEFYEARGKRMAERAAEGGRMKNATSAPLILNNGAPK